MKDIILRPVVSEKSVAGQANNIFTFLVSTRSDKRMIKDAIEKMFDVKVASVSTVNYKPTVETTSKRTKYVKKGFKKAMVRLTKGSKMPLFEEGKKEK